MVKDNISTAPLTEEEKKKKRAEYCREYRAAHLKVLLEYHREYRAAHKKKRSAYNKAYNAAHKQERLERDVKRRAAKRLVIGRLSKG